MTEQSSDAVIRCEGVWNILGKRAKEAFAAIRAEGLSKDEVRRRYDCTVGVQDARFAVRRGEIFCIMGLSGSGKSTLIRPITRLKEPTAGAIYIEGQNINDASQKEMPGGGCERIIEHHLDEYGLRDSVVHNQGSYNAIMADAMARHENGEPILYYIWSRCWVSGVLAPGQDVEWLSAPCTAPPDGIEVNRDACDGWLAAARSSQLNSNRRADPMDSPGH
jgi:energy-coupling factor transporter ATP-binding protein EcfA2